MVKANELANEIAKELQRYTKATVEKVEVAKKENSKTLLNEIKMNSPQRRPRYKKGWRTKKIGTSYITYNKTDYQLTHLLEHGHITRNGKRSTDEKVHIRPAEQKAIKSFLNDIEKAVKA